MPTFNGQVKDRQITLTVWVNTVDPASGEVDTTKVRPCQALLDTGAQVTLVSQNVAKGAGLVSTGSASLVPASGQEIEVPKYKAGISVPVTEGDGGMAKGMILDVAQLPYQPHDYEVLLGMDFLVHFHVTLYGQVFVFSI